MDEYISSAYIRASGSEIDYVINPYSRNTNSPTVINLDGIPRFRLSKPTTRNMSDFDYNLELTLLPLTDVIEQELSDKIGYVNVDIATHEVAGIVKPTEDFIIDSEGTLSINKDALKLTARQVLVGEDLTSTLDVGGIKSLDQFSKSSDILGLITKLISARIKPTYVQPKANLIIPAFMDELEVGTELEWQVTSEYIKNDGGDYITKSILYNSELMNPTGVSTVTIPIVISDSSNLIKTQITFRDGPIKVDNLGNPDPDGRIKSGMVEYFKSIKGSRATFISATKTPVPITADDIRAKCSYILGVKSTDELSMHIPLNTRSILIAVPHNLGGIKSLTQQNIGLNILSSFNKFKLQIPGSNNYIPVDYDIYTYNSAIGLDETDYIIKFTN